MKDATNHAKAIRRAARLREKYSLQAEFFTEASEESEQLIEDDVPQKVTSRHTVGNVMDLFPPNRLKNEDTMTKKRSGIELTRQPHELDKFMSKKDGEIIPGDRVMFDEEKGEKKNDQVGLGLQRTKISADVVDDEEVNPNDIIPPIVYNWIGSIVENLSPSVSYSTQQLQAQVDDSIEFNTTATRVRAETLDKLDQLMYTSSIKFKCLEFFMESLENIVITPIVYLCKGLDPIALNLALEYVATNELTNNIIVLHIVDDRNIITSHHQIINKLLSLGMEKDSLKRYHKKLLIEHVTGVLQDKLKTTRNSLEKKKSALSVTDVYDIHYELDTILENLPEEIKSLPKLVSLFDTLYM